MPSYKRLYICLEQNYNVADRTIHIAVISLLSIAAASIVIDKIEIAKITTFLVSLFMFRLTTLTSFLKREYIYNFRVN